MKVKRYSRQREMIYQTLMESKEHPTAEMLYKALKPENPSLSLGTVYRNLGSLAEEGAVVRLSFPVERYDARLDRHAHMECLRCHRVLDIELDCDDEIDVQASQAAGCEIRSHEIVFFGICSMCRDQMNEEE